MMDVDDFSRINDTQGPAVEDVLLKDVANRLQHCLRDCERLGPELSDPPRRTPSGIGSLEPAAMSSVWCCRESQPWTAPRWSRAECRALSRGLRHRRTGGALSAPSASASSLSMHPAQRRSSTMRMQRCITRRRRIAAAWEFFKKSISTRAAKRMSLEADLRKAVERREFSLSFQHACPSRICRSRASRHCCAGASQRGMVPRMNSSAGRAERADRGNRRLGIARGLRAGAAVADADSNAWQVAVNVSACSFATEAWCAAWRRHCGGRHRPVMIELEFTRARSSSTPAVSKAVNSLKDLGVARPGRLRPATVHVLFAAFPVDT